MKIFYSIVVMVFLVLCFSSALCAEINYQGYHFGSSLKEFDNNNKLSCSITPSQTADPSYVCQDEFLGKKCEVGFKFNPTSLLLYKVRIRWELKDSSEADTFMNTVKEYYDKQFEPSVQSGKMWYWGSSSNYDLMLSSPYAGCVELLFNSAKYAPF